jgi:hypothetical protein
MDGAIKDGLEQDRKGCDRTKQNSTVVLVTKSAEPELDSRNIEAEAACKSSQIKYFLFLHYIRQRTGSGADAAIFPFPGAGVASKPDTEP